MVCKLHLSKHRPLGGYSSAGHPWGPPPWAFLPQACTVLPEGVTALRGYDPLSVPFYPYLPAQSQRCPSAGPLPLRRGPGTVPLCPSAYCQAHAHPGEMGCLPSPKLSPLASPRTHNHSVSQVFFPLGTKKVKRAGPAIRRGPGAQLGARPHLES